MLVKQNKIEKISHFLKDLWKSSNKILKYLKEVIFNNIKFNKVFAANKVFF